MADRHQAVLPSLVLAVAEPAAALAAAGILAAGMKAAAGSLAADMLAAAPDILMTVQVFDTLPVAQGCLTFCPEAEECRLRSL